MRRGRAVSTDVAQVSADKGVGANGAHQAAAKEGDGDPETSLCSKAIKIMTYNVCFGKDYELHSRILALGNIIQHHSPDLICLQEVTPEIQGLLEKSAWWPEYKCFMSREMEYYMKEKEDIARSNMGKTLSKRKKYMERSYFCMQV
ncbi:hypothetical protein CFC21_008649 [Triticum aestivum]|uniref:Endonuclease/exonuclease/phosphatase domain-containing protein n=3 Tax=Triticum aestivum TaxID=4565 RepID=A0A3B5Z325_WHEAT|nr:hypothetical protein CFC21_008649 [Triticum aestivum]